jgi:hypothetical protein
MTLATSKTNIFEEKRYKGNLRSKRLHLLWKLHTMQSRIAENPQVSEQLIARYLIITNGRQKLLPVTHSHEISTSFFVAVQLTPKPPGKPRLRGLPYSRERNGCI